MPSASNIQQKASQKAGLELSPRNIGILIGMSILGFMATTFVIKKFGTQ